MIPQYNKVKFTDVWNNVDSFITDLAEASSLTNVVSETNQRNLFLLLYAKYGNSHIANYDITQFKYKIYAIIYKYGGTWQKKLAIQEQLRSLTDEQIRQGTKVINNHAMNPATDPSTAALDELTYIDAQNTTNYKKGAVEAYGQLWQMLDENITDMFIERFSECFSKFARPDINAVYIDDEQEEI